MCTDQARKTSLISIEPVDNWHKQWPAVLAAIETAQQRDTLLVDRDGWLSARQVLLVAFADAAVVGHLCFTLKPAVDAGGQVIVEARLDAIGVAAGRDREQVMTLLKQAAQQRAATLKCGRFVGFE